MSQRNEARDRARAARLAREAKADRRRRLLQFGTVGVVVVALAVGITLATRHQSSGRPGAADTPGLRVASLSSLRGLRAPPAAGALGPEGVPVPNAADLTAPGTAPGPVDGIQCLRSEQIAFHIHAHLTIFDDGVARRVPAAVGIKDPQITQTPQGSFAGDGSCFAWLHTHAADGIIHIESPVTRTFTLGDFFDVWGQPLAPDRVGPVSGHVTALYNGRVVKGNPRSIPLTAHAQIQLDIGRPLVAPESITFPQGL